MCGSEHTLGGPINYRTLNSSSKIAELKHTLMHKCMTFSASRLCHRFLISAWSGSTRYHNALPKKVSSDVKSLYNDCLMHSVFAKNLNLSQDEDSDTQIHTIHYFIAEIHPVSIHWRRMHAILLLCWGIRCLNTLLSYTQHYYIVVVYTTLIHCWAIPNPYTLLR